MALIDETTNGLGAVLLPVVAGLLLEELTLGGLVRLLLAPWPKPSKPAEHNNRRKEEEGDGQCSH
jgi:hypothetical protein